MAAALPGEFDLGLGGRFVELSGDGYDPDLAIRMNVGVRCHNHSRPALGILALRVEKFYPDNPSAAELRHDGLR